MKRSGSRFIRLAFLIATLCAVPPMSRSYADDWPTKPDPAKTSGKTTGMSLDKICATQWGSDARHVTPQMKANVTAEYHFDSSICPLTKFRGHFVHRAEIDHLVPRSLGGADDEANLWPECYEPVNSDKSQQADGANKKDRLEKELHRRVCNTKSVEKLHDYQTGFETDWLELYHQIYGDD